MSRERETPFQAKQGFFNSDQARRNAGIPLDRRVNHFVMCIEPIRFPTDHNLTDEINVAAPVSADYEELLRLGEDTIVASRGTDKKTCPNLVFMTPTAVVEEYAHLYTPHLLSTYMPVLDRERQMPEINFTFAAHGDNKRIGSSTLDTRRTAPEVAADFIQFLEMTEAKYLAEHPGSQFSFKDRPLNICFESCNAALCDTTGKTQAEVANEIKTNSFIGQFSEIMKMNGYSNVTVSGYKGYFSHLTSKKGALVSNHWDPSVRGDLALAESTKAVIHPNNSVELGSRFLTYEVNLRPGMTYERDPQIEESMRTERDFARQAKASRRSAAALLTINDENAAPGGAKSHTKTPRAKSTSRTFGKDRKQKIDYGKLNL